MNHQRKKAAVTKYAELHKNGATKEELVDALSSDEKEYTTEEVAEIYQALVETNSDATGTKPPDPGTKTSDNVTKPPPLPTKIASVNPNDNLGLANFDYKNLRDGEWSKYQELVDSLPLYGQYDFHLFRAKPLFRDRYPGIKDSPVDMVGIEIKNDTPEHRTRVSVMVAKEFNGQILNQHSRAGHGKYYLLAK